MMFWKLEMPDPLVNLKLFSSVKYLLIIKLKYTT